MAGQIAAKDQPSSLTTCVERVAIVGAAGQLGRHITQEILKTNKHTITALTRKEGASKFPEGVKAAFVDYDDEESIVSALKGHDFLIITLAYSAGNEIHNKIVQAAAKAKIPHLMPNIYTADVVLNNETIGDETGMGPAFRPLLSEIERLGLTWTVLVTGLWYEFSLACPPDWFGFDINKREVTIFDDGQARINTTTWPQCGRAVASFLGLKKRPEDNNDSTPTLQQFQNTAIYVSSFMINQREMLASVKRVTGTTDADWNIRYESTAKRIQDGRAALAAGDPKGLAKAYYSRIFSPDCPAIYQKKLHNGLLGLPDEDLDHATVVGVDMAKRGYTPF
ncbi:oxidoreductase [Trichoderma arundinaceum]|uniref:Oxidoreductase n=1 Tax=Trichoderma arundinaceum TaxID=490622 RepID=A0A395NIB2_TRIAR|nr:oxidoreductase [Trichoderma arundinaceum]